MIFPVSKASQPGDAILEAFNRSKTAQARESKGYATRGDYGSSGCAKDQLYLLVDKKN